VIGVVVRIGHPPEAVQWRRALAQAAFGVTLPVVGNQQVGPLNEGVVAVVFLVIIISVAAAVVLDSCCCVFEGVAVVVRVIPPIAARRMVLVVPPQVFEKSPKREAVHVVYGGTEATSNVIDF
jgi:hypothetical protein